MARTVEEQLQKYLADAHSIEEQAIQQLKKAPDIAADPEIAAAFRAHDDESREQKRLVDERLAALGASPSKFKDLIMRAGGEGFVLFAKFNPDSTGKLMTHSFSYEALEEASYELLVRVAERAGDAETAAVGRRILEQERTMKERIASMWDASVNASLAEKGADDMRDEIVSYLADAHALEAQADQMLSAAPKIVGDWPELEKVFTEHLEETRHHKKLVEERLDALEAGPNVLKDVQMRFGALNWGSFFKGHPDTSGKLVAFAYAFEHLEIGGYEQLKRTARRAGDEETARMVEEILPQERAASEKLRAHFDLAARASLEEVGASA